MLFSLSQYSQNITVEVLLRSDKGNCFSMTASGETTAIITEVEPDGSPRGSPDPFTENVMGKLEAATETISELQITYVTNEKLTKEVAALKVAVKTEKLKATPESLHTTRQGIIHQVI